MWEAVLEFLQEYTEELASVAVLASASGWGWSLFRRRKVEDERDTLDQRGEELRLELMRAEVRLDHIDPERFIDKAAELYDAGEFGAVQDLAQKFVERQQEAFGTAAEYLAEQGILDSEKHPEAIKDAVRFATIGCATLPDNKRIEELQDLAKRRSDDIQRGDPIEALFLDGLTDVELNELGRVLLRDGRFSLAEVAARRSAVLAFRRTGKRSINYCGAVGFHANCLSAIGANSDAEKLYRSEIEILREIAEPNSPHLAKSLGNFAGILLELDASTEAEICIREAIQIDEVNNSDDPLGASKRLEILAMVFAKQGKRSDAEAAFDDAVALGRKSSGAKSTAFGDVLSNFGNFLYDDARFDEAELVYRQAVDISLCDVGEANPHHALHLGNLGNLLAKTGRTEEGRKMLQQSLAIFHDTLPPEHPYIAEAERRLADLPA